MAHRVEWDVIAPVEVRTKVSSQRVRMPDVIVDRRSDGPRCRKEGTVFDPPLIAIEILSPTDSYAQTQRLANEYRVMGIKNIWLIEPETRTGRFCTENAWIESRRFEVEGTRIHLDLDWLFAELDDLER